MPKRRHILVRAIGLLSDRIDPDVEAMSSGEQAFDATLGRRPFRPLVPGKDVDAAVLGNGAGLPIGQGTRREREDILRLEARLQEGFKGGLPAVKTVLTASDSMKSPRAERDLANGGA